MLSQFLVVIQFVLSLLFVLCDWIWENLAKKTNFKHYNQDKLVSFGFVLLFVVWAMCSFPMQCPYCLLQLTLV